MNRRIRVLIIDDHPIVRQGIRSLIEAEPGFEVIGEASGREEALAALEGDVPDVAIVDISLKGSDGLELTKVFHASFPNLKVLIVSMHDEELYAERALRAGASGYLMKDELADTIIDALHAISQGRIHVSEAIRQRILHRSVDGPATESSIERLSDRELEVLRLIGLGFGTRQIAETLNLSIKTIETYRAHLKEKLSIPTAPELVRYAVTWMSQAEEADDE